MIKRILLLALLAFTGFYSPAHAANLDVQQLRAEAKNGDAKAQAMLGILYQWGGQGITQDNTEAIKWLQRAAQQNNSLGLDGLGYAYREGKGVSKDLVQAYAYYSLAVSAEGWWGSKDIVRHKDDLGKQLTPDQIARAKKLVHEWSAKRP